MKAKLFVEKIKEVYKIQNTKNEKIFVIVQGDKITLKTHDENDLFYFIKSDPQRIKRIAEMFLEAIKLIK